MAVTLTKDEAKQVVPRQTRLPHDLDMNNPSQVRNFIMTLVQELNELNSEVAILKAQMAKAQPTP